MSVYGPCRGAPGARPQCDRCPGSLPAHEWPDPAAPGTTYTIPASTCEHDCHAAEVPLAATA